MDNLEPITRNEMFLNGDDLEPITREEMILAGADLEPITRHEWFLKKYRGGGGGGGYDLVNVPNLPADIASFTDGTDLPMASLKVAVTPYQDLSHGDPSPDNICPIIGWDEAVVNVTGINIWDEECELGTINDTTGQDAPENGIIRSKGYIAVKSGIQYYIKKPTNSDIYQIFLYRSDKTFMYAVLVSNIINRVYTIPSGCSFIRFRCLAAYGNTYKNDISINYPSTDTSYHAYNGATTTIPFTDSQGNPVEVFGGSVDVVNGEGANTHKSIIFDGSNDEGWETYDYQGVLSFRTTISDMKNVNPNINSTMCNEFKFTPYAWAVEDFAIYGYSATRVFFRPPNSGITNLTEFRTWLSNNNLQLRYELATPITVQLAKTPVKSLEGTNNIFADCGQITEVKYFKKA